MIQQVKDALNLERIRTKMKIQILRIWLNSGVPKLGWGLFSFDKLNYSTSYFIQGYALNIETIRTKMKIQILKYRNKGYDWTVAYPSWAGACFLFLRALHVSGFVCGWSIWRGFGDLWGSTSLPSSQAGVNFIEQKVAGRNNIMLPE